MPKGRRGRYLQRILGFLAFLASSAAGSLLLNHANELKGADPDRDVLPYEVGGLTLFVLAVISFLVALTGGAVGSLASDAVNGLTIAAGRLPGWLSAQDRVLWARQALYAGIFGGLGATLGWFTWAALAILVAHPHEVWVSALVGAVVGTAVDGGRRYREIARSSSTEDRASRRSTPFFGLICSILGVFLGVAAEHALGEVISEVRTAFLFSLLIYVVGGIAVAGAARLTGRLEDLSLRVPSLLFVGMMIGLLLSLLEILAGAVADTGALMSWWALITVVAGIVAAPEGRSLWRAPIVAIISIPVIALAVLLTASNPLEAPDTSTTHHPFARALIQISVSVTEGLLKAPDIPATSWTAAQRELQESGSVSLIEPKVPPVVSRWAGDIAFCDQIPANPDDENPARFLARKRELCGQIAAATGSTWSRSITVIFFFVVALAVAPRWEARWRPADYGAHPIRRVDRIGAVILASCVLVSVIALRLTGALHR
jgi:hypothetical protein